MKLEEILIEENVGEEFIFKYKDNFWVVTVVEVAENIFELQDNEETSITNYFSLSQILNFDYKENIYI